MKSMSKYVNEQTVALVFIEYDGRFLTAKDVIASAVYELLKKFRPEKYIKERVEKILYFCLFTKYYKILDFSFKLC